jgi:predicted enzyme related to lactoylglutathione lyase
MVVAAVRPNADETTNKVAANGGKILMPAMAIGDLGRMALFQDPRIVSAGSA